jgi:hypothetical protein
MGHIQRLSGLVCLLIAGSAPTRASILVAGTDPDSSGAFDVENDSGGVFSYEQLFTLSSGAHVTNLSINAASFSDQTLEVELFSGLGLEGTGTLLQTFDINVPGTFDGLLPDIPTITIPTSFSLGPGSYSLLLSLPTLSPSGDLIYENAADSLNTPDGSLGGTHWSTSIDSPGNIVFDLAGEMGSPVPEPGSMSLLVTALVAIAALIRKRVRQEL